MGPSDNLKVYIFVIITFIVLVVCTYFTVEISPEKFASITRNSFYVCEKQLPKSLIIGAPKCGTAALATFLSFHPDISVEKRLEFNFFSDNYNLGFDWYKEKLPCSRPGQLVVERSSNYFVREEAKYRIWQMNKNTKLILIVCEPVTRTISHFAMRLENNKIPNMSVENFLFPHGKPWTSLKYRYIMKDSNYSFFFGQWLRVFPLEQFHIVNGDNLKINPWQEVTAVEKFLGVKGHFRRKDFVYNQTKGFFCYKGINMESPHCLCPGKGRKHPHLNKSVKNRLVKFFRPYNKLFYKQCNRKFEW